MKAVDLDLAIQLSWTIASDGGDPILGYFVYWSPASPDNSTKRFYAGQDPNATVTGLVNEVTYIFQVPINFLGFLNVHMFVFLSSAPLRSKR